jgi:hypothetical protein
MNPEIPIELNENHNKKKNKTLEEFDDIELVERNVLKMHVTNPRIRKAVPKSDPQNKSFGSGNNPRRKPVNL